MTPHKMTVCLCFSARRCNFNESVNTVRVDFSPVLDLLFINEHRRETYSG